MAWSRSLALLAALHALLAPCAAGPVGPLPNVTSSDLGLKEGSCALGDVVYMPGDEFPGAGPCERCACAGGGVRCARVRCEPRPGCKALHRPDHCCPTYQCECEQEGRVYGNGEKLVDPLDPCRVCYCQGGEVVCRRIACFVRDDCRPRLVPGRCCPEYDNCPLRGVTTIPGVSLSSATTAEETESSPLPPSPKEHVKQEITIKEITPVSEIPVITEVKIKEILPSPSIEVAEYSSSKSPLIVREATSEKAIVNEHGSNTKTETPAAIELQSSSSPVTISSAVPEVPANFGASKSDIKSSNDSPPSKISLSTQDSINSEIYPEVFSSVATMGAGSIVPEYVPGAGITKAHVIDEEDTSLFDHNPAFPPIPDDLSVSGNHEDEIIQESNVDSDHVSVDQEAVRVSTVARSTATETVVVRELLTTTSKEFPGSTPSTIIKVDPEIVDTTTHSSSTTKSYNIISTASTNVKESPMLNLRSAIPTEILNVPSFVPEEITGELDEATELTTMADLAQIFTSTASENIVRLQDNYTDDSTETYASSTVTVTNADTTTHKTTKMKANLSSSSNPQVQTTSSIPKSNIATEITASTELSSLPVETSDQNPHEVSETTFEQSSSSTVNPFVDISTTRISSPLESEVITVSRPSSSTENHSYENVETTEFILTPFSSAESATDAVELIKISADTEKSAAIIESSGRKKNNVLTDLINLVGDVASIGDHTDSPEAARHAPTATSISDSEELIPVNAGYKSKNSNWNLNSITEIPVKSKNQASSHKQKVVEIEDDETDNITDPSPPNDKVEPTTRRPIIDNVSDDVPNNKTEKKDIEIITKSYVPTINRRPTKVVMKKSNDRPTSDEMSIDAVPLTFSSEVSTESTVASTSEAVTLDEAEVSAKVRDRRRDLPAATSTNAASSTDTSAGTSSTDGAQ